MSVLGVERSPSNADVKERVELYLYPISGLAWQVIVRTGTFTFNFSLTAYTG
jgi:hypothetical protein